MRLRRLCRWLGEIRNRFFVIFKRLGTATGLHSPAPLRLPWDQRGKENSHPGSRSVNPGLKAATPLRLATKRKTVSKVDSNANVGMAPMALTSRLNFFTKVVERSSRLSEDLLLLRLRKSGSPAPLGAECL